jgi:PAS domain S-box-containing protein
MDQAGSQQRDLFESERSFRLLVEAVTDYALYMLDPTGLITSWNVGGQRIKGYDPEEILGQHFSRFYTETDRANGKPARALKIAEQQGRYEEEGWRVRKDGTFFWASVIIDPIREDDKLVGFAKITRDISERREAELKLEQIQKHLAESQKLDALGQLTGGVAHDFNNLLMIVSGNIHTLKKGIGDNTRLQRAVTAIETAVKRGASLTSQLLTFARRQSVNPQSIDVAERMEAIREVLDTGVGRGVELAFDIASDVWPVAVDISELETALVNLVINARYAMPSGGTITVAAHTRTATDDTGDHVAISVEDTGTGIAPDAVPHVFERFYRGDKARSRQDGGFGLGLAIVKWIAESHNGAVDLASTPGSGSTFTVTLPR